jgi:hypothetical protein
MSPVLPWQPIAAIGGGDFADWRLSGANPLRVSRLRIKRADPIYQADTDISDKLPGR